MVMLGSSVAPALGGDLLLDWAPLAVILDMTHFSTTLGGPPSQIHRPAE